jgi:hypothetical protein
MSSTHDVIVVGGGLCGKCFFVLFVVFFLTCSPFKCKHFVLILFQGLWATKLLQDKGLKVLMVEADLRLGGRIHSELVSKV